MAFIAVQSGVADAVGFTNITQRNPRLAQCQDFYPFGRAQPPPPTIFSLHVDLVVCTCTYKQMFWIDTASNITAVKHTHTGW